MIEGGPTKETLKSKPTTELEILKIKHKNEKGGEREEINTKRTMIKKEEKNHEEKGKEKILSNFIFLS